MEQPSYFSIIPATVRYDNSLTMTERMLFGEITALSNKNGYCTASNGYFANLYRNKSGNPASKPSVSRWIRHLNEHGYIKLEYVWNDSKTIKARRMFPILDAKGAKQNERGVNKNVNTPYQECEHPLNKNVKENNTSNNNTSNNISSSYYPEHKYSKKILTDPFVVIASSKEEQEKKIDALINQFEKENGGVFGVVEHQRIQSILTDLRLDQIIDLFDAINDSLRNKNVRNPVSYLIKSLINNRGDLSATDW